MKTKYFMMLALMLCVGAFLFPTAVQAAQVDPPRVQTSIRGEILRVEAQNGFYAVEAIFVNDRRFNFRVDSVLQVDLLAFDDAEIITVYAIDFAGNRSNTVTVVNPHYVPIVSTPQPPQGGIPVTPTQSNPFTPDGQASVLDNATDGDEKEFFTFTTPAGNVFFLIVDRQRESDNVYFLNAVTEQDLIALAERAGNEITVSGDGGIPVSTIPMTPDEPPTDGEETDEPEEPDTPIAERSSNNGTLIFLLFAIAIGGGAGYYFKIVRPKQQAEDDDYADEDEEDLGEEMEFENEPSEAGNPDTDGDYYDLSDSEDSENGEDGEDDEVETEDDGL